MAAACKQFAARADGLVPSDGLRSCCATRTQDQGDASTLALGIRGRWLTSSDRFTDLKSHMTSKPPLGPAIIDAGISRRGSEKSCSFERATVFGDLRRAPTLSPKLSKPLFQTYGAMVAFTR
jgi:hypothetical protein